MSIRQNIGNLYQMKKCVGAILHHCTDTKDLEKRHRYCLRSEDSWCSYWNKAKGYRTKLNLPEAVKVELTELFNKLRNEKLLSKCLHRKVKTLMKPLTN